MSSPAAFTADPEALAARAIAALPEPVQRRLAGRPRVLDGQVLDPGIQLLLRILQLRGSGAFIASPDAAPEAERARIHREARGVVGRWSTPVGAVAELSVDGGVGPLVARHYAPAEAARAPLIVFFHGGGWVVGDLDSHDEPCRLLCRHAEVHVLSVAYRLAPEHPFPAAVHDAVAATRWALGHAAGLGADPARVGVGGDSAGGNLAAVVARELAGGDGPPLALQLLIYPGTDLTGSETRSARLFGRGFYLDDASREWCMDRYLPAGIDRADPLVSPLRGDPLSGLAPAVVVTGAFDPLRDEGEAYAAALTAAGNRVASHRAEGLIHGFINLTTVNRRSRDAVLALAGMARSELAPR